jgi:hypothetical protein
MGFFKKPEVVILKDDSSADEMLVQLKQMCSEARGELKKELENQIFILERGLKGEEEILFQLKYAGMDMFVLHDVYFEVGDLSAQIDFLIITPKLNFIIECKNLYGDITIDNKGNFVRSYQVRGRKVREGIESPVTQNQRHLQVMKELIMSGKSKMMQYIIDKNFDSWNKSLIVLANNKTVLNDRYAPRDIKNRVIRADALVDTIKKIHSESTEIAQSIKETRERAEDYFNHSVPVKTDFLEKYRIMLEEQNKNLAAVKELGLRETTVQKEFKGRCNENSSCSETNKLFGDESVEIDSTETKNNQGGRICPRCNAKLVRRNSKYGAFWGCSNFPKCRYTKSVKEDE